MNSQNNVDNEVIAEEENNTKKTTQRKSTKRTEKKLLATLYEVNPKTKRKVEVDINDGSIDWKNVKEDRARLYCFYYTLAGAPSYHNSAESYRMTGTKCKDSQVLAVAAFKFRQKHPEITQFISDFEENIIKVNLKEARNAVLQMKMKQAFMNPKQFLQTKTINTKDGLSFQVLDIKNIEDISDEDAITYLSGFQAVGREGRIVYLPIDKQRVQSEILALTKPEGDDKDGMEIETTAEIIKGNLQVKTKVIKNNSDIAELSDLRTENTAERAEED